MPNMADITVKNAAGTDVVYVAAMPSAGDSSPARWTQNAASGVIGFRPSFEIVSKVNAAKDVRRLEFTANFPVTFTDSSSGAVTLLGSIKTTGVTYLPASIDTAKWTDAFTQMGNLLVSTLIRSSASTGYAPT